MVFWYFSWEFTIMSPTCQKMSVLCVFELTWHNVMFPTKLLQFEEICGQPPLSFFFVLVLTQFHLGHILVPGQFLCVGICWHVFPCFVVEAFDVGFVIFLDFFFLSWINTIFLTFSFPMAWKFDPARVVCSNGEFWWASPVYWDSFQLPWDIILKIPLSISDGITEI